MRLQSSTAGDDALFSQSSFAVGLCLRHGPWLIAGKLRQGFVLLGADQRITGWLGLEGILEMKQFQAHARAKLPPTRAGCYGPRPYRMEKHTLPLFSLTVKTIFVIDLQLHHVRVLTSLQIIMTYD